MVHVSFRYIFGIPPLILVLLPVASSDCDIGGKDGEEYESVIMVSINYLDNMLETDSSCLNNESNFFKKHSCDDNKVKERKLISSGEAQPTKNLEENRQKCLLKILLQKIKTCWNKILKEHAGTHR
ncbi:interleukin-7 isoform X6 [Erinaceus europaeus]|uniref:Interleukin-7 n=1 Tax=Erinaceus europaeus TaxID=9365 RepID=A0ABM3Y3X6_ERIEU|nr:interleukin-7 isoform X6 [Erinaceus europaeus]